MEEKKLDLWSIESKIYAKIDATMMRGQNSYKERFDLGQGQRFDITITSKTGSPTSLHQQFKTSEISFSANFGSGTYNSFRVDNQSNHGFLHFHFESGTQGFNDRIPLPEITTVSGIINEVFKKAEEIIPLHFPNFFVNGSGFVGTA